MPDVIRHPAGGEAGGLDSCFRRNDGRLYRIVICLDRYRQQFAQVLVDLFQIVWLDTEQPEVAVDAVNHAELAAGNELLLGFTVARRERTYLRQWEGQTPWRVIRSSACLRSPPVCRLTSPRCHFQAMHSRLFGSMGRK